MTSLLEYPDSTAGGDRAGNTIDYLLLSSRQVMHGTACAMYEEPCAAFAPTGIIIIEGRVTLIIKPFIDYFVFECQLAARKGWSCLNVRAEATSQTRDIRGA